MHAYKCVANFGLIHISIYISVCIVIKLLDTRELETIAYYYQEMPKVFGFVYISSNITYHHLHYRHSHQQIVSLYFRVCT